MNYSEKLMACKSSYPFEFWLECFNDGFGEYSPEYCEYVKRNFDNLLNSLINLGESASIACKKIVSKSQLKS